MTDSGDSIERRVDSVTTTWLEAARRGDNDAWIRLQVQFRRLVCWWCAQGGIPAHEIEEVAQGVFVALWSALPRYEPQSFRGFLRTITRNKIADYWRGVHGEPPGVGGSTMEEFLNSIEAKSCQGDSVASVETKLLFDGIVDFVQREFSDQDRRAFLLRLVEQQSASAVARELGMNCNRVYLATSRILRRVREEFGDGWPREVPNGSDQ